MDVAASLTALNVTASEMRQFSDLAHNASGWVIAAAALCLLAAGLGYRQRTLSTVACYLLFTLALGFGLAAFLIRDPSNVIAVTAIVFALPQISVHLIMIGAFMAGALGELLWLDQRTRGALLSLALPTALIINGYVNLLHPHGPTQTQQDMGFHTLLGVLFVTGGILFLVHRLIEPRHAKVTLIASMLFFLICSGMLMQYHEAPDAYEYLFQRVVSHPTTH